MENVTIRENNNDYGDCLYIKPNIEEEYNKKGINIDLIYEEVVNKNTSAPFYNPITSEYGIITGKIKVNVLYDKTIRLSAYRENVTQLITMWSSEFFLEQLDIFGFFSGAGCTSGNPLQMSWFFLIFFF